MSDIVAFDSVVNGQTSFGFDGNRDGIVDIIFSTTDPSGFNTVGPGTNQIFIQEPGLEGTSLLRSDLGVKFVEGATGGISFGFALNSSSANAAYNVEIDVFDEDGNLLASEVFVANYSDTPSGASSFPEGQVDIEFTGVASYLELDFNSEDGRFIMDNFAGNYESPEVDSNEIVFFDSSPYDGMIETRGLPGIEATFGYSFSGTEISAEFIVRGNGTLADAAASRGFEYFNYLQVVVDYPDPGGVLGGCLGEVPFLDPPQGGCIFPPIEADNLPFYYDVGDAWVGTDFFFEDYLLSGYDRGTQEKVDVGFRFADQPFSAFAGPDSPMSFILMPVGVFADGTYETLTTEALYWQSTNNFFGGSAEQLAVMRSNPVDDGLEQTILSGGIASISELPEEVLDFLEASGLVGLNVAPEAQNDAFSVSEDSSIAGNVLHDNGDGVDSDPDGDALTASLVSGPAEGVLTFEADGSFSYEADAELFDLAAPGDVIEQSFTYEITDEFGAVDQATATIAVTILDDGVKVVGREHDAHASDNAHGFGHHALVGTDGGEDLILGTKYRDEMYGLDGADVIKGGRGNDLIRGGESADTLFGGKGWDSLFGDEGTDGLFGGRGHDHLFGGAGEDLLSGGRSYDALDGGTGNDLLRGGGGRDVFIFTEGFGQDTVLDFTVRRGEVLDFSDVATSQDDFAIELAEDGIGTRITLNETGEYVDLLGVAEDEFDLWAHVRLGIEAVPGNALI